MPLSFRRGGCDEPRATPGAPSPGLWVIVQRSWQSPGQGGCEVSSVSLGVVWGCQAGCEGGALRGRCEEVGRLGGCSCLGGRGVTPPPREGGGVAALEGVAGKSCLCCELQVNSLGLGFGSSDYHT